jgi:hypothetical protein
LFSFLLDQKRDKISRSPEECKKEGRVHDSRVSEDE